jgi:hypothetical protein
MIDPATLALTVFNFLLPHLDYIRGKVADAALTESGKALVSVLKDKWLAHSETAKTAVADAAENPTDPENREAVVTQLRKALKSDPDFAQEVSRLATAAGVQLTITGDNNKTAVIQGSGNIVDIR